MDISEEASRSVVWSESTFSSTVSKTLNCEDIFPKFYENIEKREAAVTCEFILAKTPYRDVRWQRVPKLPLEFKTNNIIVQNHTEKIRPNIISIMLILTLNLFC